METEIPKLMNTAYNLQIGGTELTLRLNPVIASECLVLPRWWIVDPGYGNP